MSPGEETVACLRWTPLILTGGLRWLWSPDGLSLARSWASWVVADTLSRMSPSISAVGCANGTLSADCDSGVWLAAGAFCSSSWRQRGSRDGSGFFWTVWNGECPEAMSQSLPGALHLAAVAAPHRVERALAVQPLVG